MDELFEIPVLHKGKECLYSAEVIKYGYVHRIKINVDDQLLFLEKDEEGSYSAIADAGNSKELDKALIQTIVMSLESLLK